MPKHTPLHNKLSKEDVNRHFPEINGGKGSRPRSSTAQSRKAYRDNYDRIFGNKNKERNE